jgi:hypothetical protein
VIQSDACDDTAVLRGQLARQGSIQRLLWQGHGIITALIYGNCIWTLGDVECKTMQLRLQGLSTSVEHSRNKGLLEDSTTSPTEASAGADVRSSISQHSLCARI